MIALIDNSPCDDATESTNDTFLGMLPQIREQARLAFRSENPEAKEELVAEVVANAYCAFLRLLERGKANVAHPSPLGWYAIRQVRSGRRVGSRINGRDICSPYGRAARGITVERLDQLDHDSDDWKEILVADRHAGPAEIAASRIDMAAWLRSLDRTKRKIAKALARSESTSDVARMFGLTPGRISQLRRELMESWESFQGMPAVAC